MESNKGLRLLLLSEPDFLLRSTWLSPDLVLIYTKFIPSTDLVYFYLSSGLDYSSLVLAYILTQKSATGWPNWDQFKLYLFYHVTICSMNLFDNEETIWALTPPHLCVLSFTQSFECAVLIFS